MPDPFPITFADVLAAKQRLASYLPATPLRNYPELDELTGTRVLVKHENHHPTNSFKIRNALCAMTALTAEQKSRGVIAATRGNHGQGLTWAGQKLHIPTVICVPIGNNPEKNRAMKDLGAELIEEGDGYDGAVAVMERLAQQRGLHAIHSTNDKHVIAGAGTLTLEALEQADEMNQSIDTMLFAVGGGSQAVGAMTVLNHFNSKTKVIGVQAQNASAIHDSWHAKKPLTHSTANTIADGVATRTTYGLTFPALQQGVSDFTTVSEDQIADAIRLMMRITHNMCEGAGAVGLAGLKKLAPKLTGRTVMIVLSGSNIDQATLKRVINQDM